jgi:hypothetical protein
MYKIGSGLAQIGLVMFMLLLCSCRVRDGDPIDSYEARLVDIGGSVEEHSYERILLPGETCSPSDGSATKVRLLEIASDGEACKIEVQNKNTGVTVSGWIRKGAYATCAPEEFGSRGLEVVDIYGDRVVVSFNSGGISRNTGTKGTKEGIKGSGE